LGLWVVLFALKAGWVFQGQGLLRLLNWPDRESRSANSNSSFNQLQLLDWRDDPWEALLGKNSPSR